MEMLLERLRATRDPGCVFVAPAAGGAIQALE
jgi:hypothetical protein